jgi:hypothetical protein
MPKRTYTPAKEVHQALSRAQERQKRYMLWYLNRPWIYRLLDAVLAVGDPKAYDQAREAGAIL